MKLLVFTPHGTAQLLASDANPAKILWASDDDEYFAETIDDAEFLDGDDEDVVDAVADYLIDVGHLRESEEIDVRVDYLDDADATDTNEDIEYDG